ncbi:MAG: c-type cytochrome [Pirellulaceae bacterium]|nr:c-type cytochrome [Pirellulaceae bacterium]
MSTPTLNRLANVVLAVALILHTSAPSSGQEATTTGQASTTLAAEEIQVPAGFVVDLVYTAKPETEGSWASLATDNEGRLIVGAEKEFGLHRITINDNAVTSEKVPVDIKATQGMVWAFDSLYVQEAAATLKRVYDSDDDGQLDAVESLPGSDGSGGHGTHAVVLNDDQQDLFIVGGNHADVPPLVGSRIPTSEEDLLLPRQWDARGHAVGRLAPGGWITRFDPKAKTHDLFCAGFRNQYDAALNRDGELFTFDADMEWDMGMSWYRPTRICHVVSGGDYGWRSGTGKWPSYYEDSLPPVIEIGPGSPTGMVSGRDALFPSRYRDAVFAVDWTFGTIYAIHIEPAGSSYTAQKEIFLTGAPLPITDAVVGIDGAMYFVTGGRGIQSALYRVRYTGDQSIDLAYHSNENEKLHANSRRIRQLIERFHGRQDAQAIDEAWPLLDAKDRFIRHAARVAIESQSVDQWAAKVFDETRPQAVITSAVALARSAGDQDIKAELQELLVEKLLQLDVGKLPDAQKLGLFRAYSLAFIRLAPVLDSQREPIATQIDSLFPSTNQDINTEWVRLSVYLQTPDVIERVLQQIENRPDPVPPQWAELISRNDRYGAPIAKLMETPPPSNEIGYAFMLRNLRNGWTLEQRKRYFEFLAAAAKFPGGNSYTGFLRNLQTEALGQCSNTERQQLTDVTGEAFDPKPPFEIQPIQGPGQVWTLEHAIAATQATQLRKADFENGRSLFHAADCGKCHRMDGFGGDIGPDLTSIPFRFDTQYVLQAMIDPSAVISDQYQAYSILLSDGRTMTGLVVPDGEKIAIHVAGAEAKTIRVDLDEIETLSPANVSQMPSGLIDRLSETELRDLVAYLLAGGNRTAKVYGKKRAQ